jgi:hypothetical protein
MTKCASGLLWTALIAATIAMTGCAQPNEMYSVERTTINGLPSVVASGSISGQATVVAIDYDNRSIALEGPDGKSEIFSVSSVVQNFNQINTGDLVKVQYVQTVDVNVRKIGEPLSTAELAGVVAAPLGDKPGVVAVRTVQTLANVQAIDYQTRSVTLIGISDKPVTLAVSPKLKDFDNVVKGDQVVFTYTEAVTIYVTK